MLGEIAGLLALLAVALPTRLVNLDAFVGKFDEGIRGEQLLLMAAGFRPFRDIFASQGPLSLDVFYPTFMLFGQTLGAARLGAVVLSVVGLLLTVWAARLVGGIVAAVTTGVVLLLSPTYLKNSRLALVEIPALAPAVAAVGAALVYQRGGDRRWLLSSGALLALALLIKPIVIPAAIPIGLLILLRRDHGRKKAADLALCGLVVAVVSAAVVALVGPADVYEQMVRFRAASRQAEGWSLRENWSAMAGELADEQPPPLVAAAAAGTLLVLARPRVGLPLVAWPLATFALLMAYSPLQFKHAVIMLPPLALLVGAGAGEWWRRWRTVGPARLPALGTRLLPLGLALWYLASLPTIASLDRRVVLALPENRPESYDDEVGLIGELTGPRDFILVDEPAVAFATRRLVPPGLVDTSAVRVRSRSLGAGEVIAALERYDVKLLFLFSDGLRSIRRLADWVDDRYVAVKINERRNGKDRALYVRRDADLSAARAALERSLERPAEATFGGQLRLLGHTLERGEIRSGGSLQLTLGWEAIGPVMADYHVLTILRDARGQVVEQNERGLGGGGEGTAAWDAGRWVFRGASLPIRAAPPGEYHLSVGLYDSRARRMLPLEGGGDGPGAAEAPLETVRVRG
jgi:Dolichyl-phosphate-mannose-protein mannosyltransferase